MRSSSRNHNLRTRLEEPLPKRRHQCLSKYVPFFFFFFFLIPHFLFCSAQYGTTHLLLWAQQVHLWVISLRSLQVMTWLFHHRSLLVGANHLVYSHLLSSCLPHSHMLPLHLPHSHMLPLHLPPSHLPPLHLLPLHLLPSHLLPSHLLHSCRCSGQLTQIFFCL